MEQSWETEWLWLNLFYHNGNAISREKDIIKRISILFSGKTFLYWVKFIYNTCKNKKDRKQRDYNRGRKNHRKKYWENRIKFCRSKESWHFTSVSHSFSVDWPRWLCCLLCADARPCALKINSLHLQGAHSWQRHLSRVKLGCVGNPSLIVKSLSWNSKNDDCQLSIYRRKEQDLSTWGTQKKWVCEINRQFPHGCIWSPFQHLSLLSPSLFKFSEGWSIH